MASESNLKASDPLGLAVTVDGAEAQAGIDAFVTGLLGYRRDAADVVAAADRAPRCALVNAYAAALQLLAESEQGPEAALPYLERAEAAAAGATLREREIVAFVRAWRDEDVARALETGWRILARWPRDLTALKLVQYHLFNQGRFAEMLKAALACREAAADLAWLHGMLAFGYEQCHLLGQAEASARTALRLRADEPWAQHALAHVMLTQGRISEGVAFLEGVRGGWSGLNSFMETHLWWHLALFRLSRGREAEVLRIYDEHAWGVQKDYSQDQIGAVSLLARLELSGVEVGARWRELGERLAARARDVGQPFLTLQYLYGLARADRPEADRLLAAIEARAATAPLDVRATWREVALPIAHGLVAHARGDAETAVARLAPVLPRLVDIGGSHAQRDLFELILLDAVIGSRRLGWAQQWLETRRAHDPDGVPLNRQLAAVYRGLGLGEEAARCEARVAATLASMATAA